MGGDPGVAVSTTGLSGNLGKAHSLRPRRPRVGLSLLSDRLRHGDRQCGDALRGPRLHAEILTQLVARGVVVAPLLLHTGVSSLEDHEPPYEEIYRVPVETARAVNAAHAAGRHVVAVGTTVVRALETVADQERTAHPGEGWTRLVITPERGLRAVDALLTGLHEPRSSHLALLEALAGANTSP